MDIHTFLSTEAPLDDAILSTWDGTDIDDILADLADDLADDDDRTVASVVNALRDTLRMLEG